MNNTLDSRLILQRDIKEIGELKRPMKFINKKLSNPNFQFIMDVPIKRVRKIHNKKTVQKHMGMYVNVENEQGLKLLVPYELLSHAKNIYSFTGMLDADYIVGSTKRPLVLKFKNLRLFDDTGYVICDVEFQYKIQY